MKDNISQYARLGLVHHMLYPQCTGDPEDHEKTLKSFIQREDIETFDCCLPMDQKRQERLAGLIRNCKKCDITFAIHLFPFKQFPLCSPLPDEQVHIRAIIKTMIEQAVAMGAANFIFASGGPRLGQTDDAHHEAFREFCGWLCAELKPHNITALLEPFDTQIDKKFLYGPTRKCVFLIESLQPQVDNFGIELDMAHIPLMGETFEHAIRTVAPYLKRVHLGNCILKDKTHPRYGDTHPPMGFPGGEIDIPELTAILRGLLEVGFLRPQNRGSLLLEMTPWPGRTVEETITDNFSRLHQAWDAVK